MVGGWLKSNRLAVFGVVMDRMSRKHLNVEEATCSGSPCTLTQDAGHGSNSFDARGDSALFGSRSRCRRVAADLKFKKP